MSVGRIIFQAHENPGVTKCDARRSEPMIGFQRPECFLSLIHLQFAYTPNVPIWLENPVKIQRKIRYLAYCRMRWISDKKHSAVGGSNAKPNLHLCSSLCIPQIGFSIFLHNPQLILGKLQIKSISAISGVLRGGRDVVFYFSTQ